jgi:hypothetical protein
MWSTWLLLAGVVGVLPVLAAAVAVQEACWRGFLVF